MSLPALPPAPLIERLARVAPLGLRFWDPLTNSAVGPGLSVSAFLPAQPDQAYPAVVNGAGVYVFHHLPALQDLENGAGDHAYWRGLTERRAFRVEVRDPAGRFLPVSFAVPLPNQGLFSPDCAGILAAPLGPSSQVPLFSAPTRQVPAGTAVLRAELHNLADDQPVPWAVVQLTAGALPPLRGMSDADGQVAVLFPYPEPQQLGAIAPTGPGNPVLVSTRRALTSQSWAVKLSVFAAPVTGPGSLGLSSKTAPDYCQVLKQLEGQPAKVWGSLTPQTPLGDQTLEYGKDLIVGTRQSPGDAFTLSKLLITRA
jgi:hypothetical protein